MDRITESESLYTHLDQMDTEAILNAMNTEDAKVASAVQLALPSVKNLVEAVLPRMKSGGRLFYIGSGTSGRLGIVDASECPPTFGVDHHTVIGLISGGDVAIRKAVEFAEDDPNQGWIDLLAHNISESDSVIGIAASGSTPYVLAALEKCNKNGILTGGITCNPNSPLEKTATHCITANTGPEFLTGSTRLKAGTAQKMILNMISTSLMIQLGKVKGNKMIDMQLTNEKLIARGCKMIMETTGLDKSTSEKILLSEGSVRKALLYFENQKRDLKK